jgi:outer membrane protein assembly factor BamB
MQRALEGKYKLNSKTNEWEWNEKYFTFAVDNLAQVNQLSESVARIGPAYQQSWQRWAAQRIILYRIAYDWPTLQKLAAELPSGVVVACDSAEALQKELQSRYQFDSLAPEQQWLLAGNLVAINPDLDERGGQVPGRASNKRWLIDSGRNWQAAVALSPNAQVLMPDQSWLLQDHGHALEVPKYIVHTAPLQHYHATLLQAGAGGSDIVLRLDARDGRIVSGVAIMPDLNNRQYPLIPLLDNDRYGAEHMVGNDFPEAWLSLTSAGDVQVSGGARILLAWGKQTKRSISLNLSMTFRQGQASGTYLARRFVSKKKPLALSQGTIGPGQALPGRKDITSGSQWRSAFGNDGTGIVASRAAWVDEPEYAQLRWVTDATIPVGRGPNTRGSSRPVDRGLPLSGGWSSPIVANENVFINYYRPSGTKYSYGATPTGEPAHDATLEMMRISADEYLRAFNVSNGQTAWEIQLPDRGLNWMGFNKGGPGTTLAVADGIAVWMGTTGEVYAVDTATGELLWLNHNGLRHELMTELKRQCLANGQLYTSRNDFQSSVVIIDGVAVVPDQMITKTDYRYDVADGLLGLDLQTGAVLWHLPEVCGKSRFQQSGQLWHHRNKDYLLASGFEGLRVIDPRIGKIIGFLPNLINRHWGYTVNGDTIIGDLRDPDNPQAATRPSAWRFNADARFEHLWTLSERYQARQGGGVAIDDRVYLQTHGTKAPGFHGVVCVDAATGRVLAEAACAVGGGEHSPFIIGTDTGQLIAATDRTRGLIFLDADPKNMAESVRYWELTMSTGYCASIVPALVDDLLIVRAPDRLMAYDLRQSQARERAFAKHWPHSPEARAMSEAEREKISAAASKTSAKQTKKKAPSKKKKQIPPAKKQQPEEPNIDDLLDGPSENDTALDRLGLD